MILNCNGLDNFMTCYRLDAEVTSFEIQKNWHFFIAWDIGMKGISKKKPVTIWKESFDQNAFMYQK